MTWRRWLHARWVLGWALLWHIVCAPFARRRRRLSTWLRRMRQEGLGPTPAGYWEAATRGGCCIGCGLCDAALNAAPTAARSMSQIVQGAARLPSDAPYALQWADVLEAHAATIRAMCPTGVDTQALAHMIRCHAATLATDAAVGPPARPGTMSAHATTTPA